MATNWRAAQKPLVAFLQLEYTLRLKQANMKIHLFSVSVQIIALIAGISILGSQVATAAVSDDWVQVGLPHNLAPAGRTFKLKHGTRVFIVPTWSVEYKVVKNGAIENRMCILRNVASIRRIGSETMITRSDGTVEHFPANAVVRRDGAVTLDFVHPGQVAPARYQSRTPDYVVP